MFSTDQAVTFAMAPTQDHMKASPVLPPTEKVKNRRAKMVKQLLAYKPRIDRTHQRFYDCASNTQ